MKRIILVLLVTTVLSTTICMENDKAKKNNISTDFKTYKNSWGKVDSLYRRAGLPKSALKLVNEIYKKAKTENNKPQIIKALIHKMIFIQRVEEEAFVKVQEEMQSELKNSSFPENAILHSMVAEQYWNYYQNNRGRFLNRTKTVNFKQNDMRTWDLSKIVEEVLKHYELSIKDKEQLRKVDISIVNELLTNGNRNNKYHPTLYDFLAHRAVDFLMNSESGLTKPPDQFTLNDNRYLKIYSEFQKVKIVTQDTLSFHYKAVKIFQDLVKFHIRTKNINALVDTDLKRLKYIYKKAFVPQKDSLYEFALRKTAEKLTKYPSASEYLFEVASLYSRQGDKYNAKISEENRWKKQDAYKLCTEIINKYPNSYGALQSKGLISDLESKSLSLTLEKSTYPKTASLGYMNYKNINKVTFKLFKISRSETVKLQRLYAEKMLKKILSKKETFKWEQNIPDEKDYQMHSTEFPIEPLSAGMYLLVAGENEEIFADKQPLYFTYFIVTPISYINKSGDNGGVEIHVLDKMSGQPLSNATVQCIYQKYNRKKREYDDIKGAKYNVDKNGYLKISKANNSNSNFSLEIINGNDTVITEDKFYAYNHKSYSRKNIRTIFFTDRSIYRPGQTVFFKGIKLYTETNEPEKNRLIVNQPVTVIFKDANYQKISSINLKTNDYGTFNGSFQIPTGLMNGNFSIYNNNGSVNIKVEEYKRPKFKVSFKPINKTYRLNEEVSIKGNADALAGFGIDNAVVKYRVVRNANYPYWCYWWGYRPISSNAEIINGVTKSDDKGEFNVKFLALPDPMVSKDTRPEFRYTIYADVTDINGETRSSQKTITIGYQSLRVDVSILSDIDKDSDKFGYSVNTTNLSGEFVPAQGYIKIFKLKSPSKTYRSRLWAIPDMHVIDQKMFNEKYPLDLFNDENNISKWEKGKPVYKAPFNSQENKNIDIKHISKWETGKYCIEIVSRDKFNNEVKQEKFFTLYSSKSKHVPYVMTQWVKNATGSFEPGDTAEILIGSSEKDVNVIYEVSYRGKRIKKEYLKLNDNQIKIKIPILEKYRGNVGYSFLFIKNDRVYNTNSIISVPWSNKDLKITFETFRDRLLPGEKEEWRLKITGPKKEEVAAEMAAVLYDASLDEMASHSWNFNPFPTFGAGNSWIVNRYFGTVSANHYGNFSRKYHYPNRIYSRLNWFGFYWNSYNRYSFEKKAMRSMRGGSAKMKNTKPISATDFLAVEVEGMHDKASSDEIEMNMVKMEEAPAPVSFANGNSDNKTPKDLSDIKARTNLNETAFFYPDLKTDSQGNVIISFTIPEALTKWKMMGFAHTKDLEYGFINNELVTQKELMVIPNTPRFFRENDKIVYTSKITNLSEKTLKGTSQLMLFNSETMEPVDQKFANNNSKRTFSVEKGKSKLVKWNLSIPEDLNAVTVKVVAVAGDFSDGEEVAVPIFKNRMLVTETMPLPVRSLQTKEFKMEKLINSGNSKTLKNHKLTLEFTSNPAWYAVQALPYMMEYPYDCAEQTFSRYYANSIASHIVSSNPKIKAVFDKWKNGANSNELLSNLEKNQELKAVMLEETPWVLDAQNESERKRRVALLFDLNKMSRELERALRKLEQSQLPSGAWSWFKGMRENRYITQHIITGFAHLKALNVLKGEELKRVDKMLKSAMLYADEQIKNDYDYLIKNNIDLKNRNIGYMQIQYLYARSYLKNIPLKNKFNKSYNYYFGQSKKYWLDFNKYLQGMISLSLYRKGEEKIAVDILKSIKEHALYSDEMGMYWKESYGYYWYQAPIETHALLIEAFGEILQDQKSVDDMKTWLIKSKQTQNWQTTKATADACFALLIQGADWLAESKLAEITVGNQKIDPEKMDNVSVEAGTGYFKTSWSGDEIKPEMGKVKVVNRNKVVAWGALYWQYFEQLDKITTQKTPLQLVKKLFIEKPSKTGPVLTPLTDNNIVKIGDRIKVRIELRVDRDMEFVHMKDMRASSFEPENVISKYKWQDGLGYYESTKDGSTNFFMDYLSKGTYVFEYPVRVTHEGDFSNGITTIQCMYAPEFASHSEGVRVKIGANTLSDTEISIEE